MSIQAALRACFPLVEITPSPFTPDGYILSPLPKPGTPAPAFQPFPLAVPQAVMDGLFTLSEYRWEERCHLAALLLVNTRTRIWTYQLPTQTSHPRGVSWQLVPQDLAQLPQDTALAGSFQTRPESDDEAAMQAVVPPFNGLHAIVGMTGGLARNVRLYVRYDEQLDWVNPSAVLVNDWLSTLQRHRPRMTLA